MRKTSWGHCKLHLNEKLFLLSIVLKIKDFYAYFSKYKIGREVDEYNHEGKNSNYERTRQLMIESHGITVIRTNPDAADLNKDRLFCCCFSKIWSSLL